MKEISYETTLQILEGVVAEKGQDHIYEIHEDADGVSSCFYVRDNAPDCGVGHVLHKLGVSLEFLRSFEGGSSSSVLAGLEEMGLMKFDAKSVILLRGFQYEQDRGTPWGACLAESIGRTNFPHNI